MSKQGELLFSYDEVDQVKLSKVTVYNWGSFNGLHTLNIDPEGTLITGENGSGKSTIIDALMTLLRPASRVSYNLAAAQEKKNDRNLVSYIRGSFGSMVDDEGNQTTLGIKDGVVELSINNDVYTINISLTDSLDSVHVGKFVGALEIYDEREDPYAYEPKTPTALTIAAPADSIEVENYGDYMETGTDNLSITLWDDNYSVVLSLFVESGATELPVGTYTFATDYSAMSVEPGELFYGFFPVGSYAGNDEVMFWLVDGNIVVAKSGDEYAISGELKSYYGTTVKVSYTGAVTVLVAETESEAPAAKVARKAVRSAAKPLKLRK